MERYHDLLQVLVRKIESQAALEGLQLTAEDILAEAVWAKNTALNIAGFAAVMQQHSVHIRTSCRSLRHCR